MSSHRSPLSSITNQPSPNRTFARNAVSSEAQENRDSLLTTEPFPQELLHQNEFSQLDTSELQEQCSNLKDKTWAINEKVAQDEAYIDDLKLLLRSARASHEILEQELFSERQKCESLFKSQDQTRSSLSHVSLLYKVSTETVRSLETKVQQQSRMIKRLHRDTSHKSDSRKRKQESSPLPQSPSLSLHSPVSLLSTKTQQRDTSANATAKDEEFVMGTQPDDADVEIIGEDIQGGAMKPFSPPVVMFNKKPKHATATTSSLSVPTSAMISVTTSPRSPSSSSSSSASSVSGDSDNIDAMFLSPTASMASTAPPSSSVPSSGRGSVSHSPSPASSTVSSAAKEEERFPNRTDDDGELLQLLQFSHSQPNELSASGSPHRRDSQGPTTSSKKKKHELSNVDMDVDVIVAGHNGGKSLPQQPNTSTNGEVSSQLSQLSQLVPRRLPFTDGDDEECQSRETGDTNNSRTAGGKKTFNLKSRHDGVDVIVVGAGMGKQIDQDITTTHQQELARLHQHYKEILESKDNQYSQLSLEYKQFKSAQVPLKEKIQETDARNQVQGKLEARVTQLTNELSTARQQSQRLQSALDHILHQCKQLPLPPNFSYPQQF